MAVLTLRILGRFEARRSSGEVAKIPIRKGQALLAFLALNPGQGVARSKLAGLLWGDRGDKQARTSLRQTLAVLRKALKPMQDQVLRADRHSVGLNGAGVEVDAMSFQDLIARGTPADLETAVSLYRGDLLDGLDLSDPGFQAWLEDERRRFHELMLEALNALMAHKGADGAPRDAIALGQRLLTLDPLREDVHRVLMVLYAGLGQRNAAEKQYQRCRELLASELNVSPEAETEALHQALLNNDTAGDDLAEVPRATVVGQREIDDGAKASLEDPSGRPPPAMSGDSRGSRRWAAAAGRALMIGGMAALIWLLPWSPSFEPPPLDRVTLQRLDVPSLAVPSFVNLSSVPEDVTESSGPPSLHRMAFPLPDKPWRAAQPFDNLSGVLEGVTEYSTAIVPAGTEPGDKERRRADQVRLAMQGEADGLWPRLADSWDLRAVRAFKARYPEARQVAEADRRIVFLIQRHREAQAALNRLGYDADPADSIWGLRSARAMRAFQSDNGMAPDGILSEALLYRLKTATPRIATPTSPMSTIPKPEPQPQPSRTEPQVAGLSPSAQDGTPEGSRWTASGKSRDGSRITATATRRGDTLKIVFDVDHGQATLRYVDHYTQSCTILVADPVFECWITGRPNQTLGAKVFGTFPRLQFTFRKTNIERSAFALPRDIALDFRPEPRLSAQ